MMTFGKMNGSDGSCGLGIHTAGGTEEKTVRGPAASFGSDHVILSFHLHPLLPEPSICLVTKYYSVANIFKPSSVL
jgi:hypothetical protein